MYDTDDTIAAIASAPGGAARGIVRLSGPRVAATLEGCFHPRADIELGSCVSPIVISGDILLADSAAMSAEIEADLYLWPGKRSYTGQPLAELHTIGSQPLLRLLLKRVCVAGARLAEPGEFTMRAFLAGRIDLTQAEAVLGVIDARAETELHTALSQLAGGLATPLGAVREQLLDLLADLEAGLDFTDEDIEFVSRGEVEKSLSEVRALVARIESQVSSRGRHDQLPRVVLVGWPNVGKSSLFNALAKGETALVASEPGTTRDYLVATLDLDGVRCQLVDTAGAVPAGGDNQAEALGQQATAVAADSADVRLLCLESGRAPNDWERAALAANAATLVVLTKCDQPRQIELAVGALATSAATGQGLTELQRSIREAIRNLPRHSSVISATAERSADSIPLAREALERALALARASAGEELVAAEVRLALTELGKVAGVVYSEDVLGRIFSKFCIGK